MIKILEKPIIIVLIALALLSIYFGAYSPYMRSRKFIEGLRSKSTIKSLEEFKYNFDKSFKYYSPIGDEEMAKFLGSDIFQIVSRPDNPKEVSRYLIDYIEPYMIKNNIRHLMILGQMYFTMWQKYGEEGDFIKAEDYFKKAYVIGPKLPPVLYGLLNFYQARRDEQKVKEIAKLIFQYWPEDERVAKFLNH
ncbi:MAG: hypothetical protein AAB596_00745 [Patescibacteria group bacterium]